MASGDLQAEARRRCGSDGRHRIRPDVDGMLLEDRVVSFVNPDGAWMLYQSSYRPSGKRNHHVESQSKPHSYDPRCALSRRSALGPTWLRLQHEHLDDRGFLQSLESGVSQSSRFAVAQFDLAPRKRTKFYLQSRSSSHRNQCL